MHRHLAAISMSLTVLLCLPPILQAAQAQRVFRGVAGPGSLLVDLGDGIQATWDIRAGRLLRVEAMQPTRRRLLTGPPTPTWFVSNTSDGLIAVRPHFRGYRFESGAVVLVYDIEVESTMTRIRVEERPTLVTDASGLLALSRSFSQPEPQSHDWTIVRRVRTATDGGVTIPVRTNGRLKPLGLDDNQRSDVELLRNEPTTITTVFNGVWSSKAQDNTSQAAGHETERSQ